MIEDEPIQPTNNVNESTKPEILSWFSRIGSEDLSNPDRNSQIDETNYKNFSIFKSLAEEEQQVDLTYHREDLEDTEYEYGRVFLWLGEYIFPEKVKDDFRQILETGKKAPRSNALHGLRVAEIGGNIMVALRHCGAEVTTTYEEDIKTGKRRYIDSKNYSQILGEEPYHITYSYAVFDMGGGVEKTLGFEDYTTGENYTELMKAISRTTASGGLSIHYGHHILEAITEDYARRKKGEISKEAREVFREKLSFEILEAAEDPDNPNFERVVLRKL